ncbi:MAG: glucosamine inositolphosphorylceramide transferase family protein [Lysobacter sp.]
MTSNRQDGTRDVAEARTPLYRLPSDGAPMLRVVVVMPTKVPAWVNRLLSLASTSPDLELLGVMVEGIAPLAKTRVPADMRALLRYERSRRAGRGGQFQPEAAGCRDGVDLVADFSRLHRVLKDAAPDLILLLGPADLAERLAGASRLGCWWLGQELLDEDAATMAVCPPLLRGALTTPIELALDGEQVGSSSHNDSLANSRTATCRTGLTGQCEHVFRKIPALLLRALRRYAEDPHEPLRQRTARIGLKRELPLPGMGVVALIRTLAERARLRWLRHRQPREDQWFVVLREGRDLLRPELPDVPQARVLRSAAEPDAPTWADPCAVMEDGRRLVFVEEWTARQPKGHLVCLEVPLAGPARKLGTVLQTPHHLSFPQVFPWKADWFMTVESGQARCVTLYRATHFPLQWEPAAELLSGWLCVDPVLHFHDDGRWYLFVTVAEASGNTWDDLFLFVSDNLLGPFTPHPANPIVSNARSGRAAGKLFRRDGRLIRPAQDCAPSYGAAIVFNEICELSPDRYRERVLGQLEASWTKGLDGCHTYSASGAFEVIDARGESPDHLPTTVVGSPAAPESPTHMAPPVDWAAGCEDEAGTHA